MAIVADVYTHVVGVDTHAATHSYCIVEAATSRIVDTAQFPTNTKGLSRAANWIARRTNGDVTDTLISAEGTGSYGTRMTRTLQGIGYRVVDAPSPKRERGKNKTDAIDAHKAALAPLNENVDDLADARAGDLHECLKTLLAARNRMAAEKTRAMNSLTALLRERDLGVDARKKPTITTIRAITRWRARAESMPDQIARTEVVRLACQVVELHALLKANEKQLHDLVADHAPALLDLSGVGPVNAAVVLNAWAFHGRIKSEAAWAALAGVSPILKESGNSSHHRLNRAGDRQLDRAFHSIVMTKLRVDAETQEYFTRRTTAGKPARSVKRVLKRHLARRLFRFLNQPGTVTLGA